ncbi:MAG: 23S rRNA (pseudouridine(1915)-N(3))-methyltransferase RlmH, partial [Candidatus Aminicenantia bacterium]
MKNLIDEYKKRISGMIPLRIIEIDEEKRKEKGNDDFCLKREKERIKENIKENECIVVLSGKGKTMSS